MSSKGIARPLLNNLLRCVLVGLVVEVGWERRGKVKAGLLREGLQVNQSKSFGIWVHLVRNKR